MKKGISIWSFPAQSLADNLKLATDAGFDGVELALDEVGEITPKTSERELLAIKRTAEDLGLETYSLACALGFNYPVTDEDPAVRAKAKDIIKRQLFAAKTLGCNSTLVIPGCVCADFIDPNRVVNYETAYNRSLEAFLELKADAEAYEVHIALENVWNKFLLSPMEMRDFIDKIDSPFVGSYLDIGNTVANGYPEHWIQILGKRIKKVHFKDYRREAGGLCGFVDLLAGDVNYPAVTEALASVGYDDWVSAEMIPNYKYYTEAIIYNTSYSMDKILGRK
ncbi:MAG: sugar phosphate isomerase/epimerase [Clostridia bacterium]|nr:sugar phosphate isomerase/epimerase [Clostridia bacterium]